MLVGIIRAGGDAKHPLYYLIVSSILNVILDVVFIAVFKMGVAGAAWATIVSEFAVCFYVFCNWQEKKVFYIFLGCICLWILKILNKSVSMDYLQDYRVVSLILRM